MQTIVDLALQKLRPQMSVSLGGGRNVLALTEELAKQPSKNLKLYSPSELTRAYGQKLGLEILASEQGQHFDLAFDGCDSIDYQFNCLKSKGGIHYFEKRAAQKSDEYFILIPKTRLNETLDAQLALSLEVKLERCFEILAAAQQLGLRAEIRLGQAVASYARTPLGNVLIDCFATDWQQIKDYNEQLLAKSGVIASSYFEGLVTGIIASEENGQGIIFTRWWQWQRSIIGV